VVVIAVNQHVAGLQDQIGFVIILALPDVNVMMDLSVITLATVSLKLHVLTHSVLSMRKLTHAAMHARMSPVTITI